MHRQLTHLLRIVGRHGYDFLAIIVPTERDPDALSVCRDSVHGISDAYAVEQFGCVYIDAYAGADFCILGGLLIDIDGDAEAAAAVVMELEGSAQASDSASDDGDADGWLFEGAHYCSSSWFGSGSQVATVKIGLT